jgi:hypothetical protein
VLLHKRFCRVIGSCADRTILSSEVTELNVVSCSGWQARFISRRACHYFLYQCYTNQSVSAIGILMDNAVKKGTLKGSDQHTQKHSCSACARRKVRCDRQQPCANCARARCPCSYSSSVSSPRPRKRHAEEILLARLHRYEELLRKNNIDFTPSDGWIHAGISINQPKAKTDKLQLSEESLPTRRSEAQAQREE